MKRRRCETRPVFVVWRSKGKEYKTQHDVPFPPFCFFMSFVRSMADEINEPSFQISVSEKRSARPEKVLVLKTDVNS